MAQTKLDNKTTTIQKTPPPKEPTSPGGSTGTQCRPTRFRRRDGQLTCILNKLTIDNLQRLGNTLLDTIQFTGETIDKFVEYLFTKVVLQSQYIRAYSELCAYLLERSRITGLNDVRQLGEAIEKRCHESINALFSINDPRPVISLIDSLFYFQVIDAEVIFKLLSEVLSQTYCIIILEITLQIVTDCVRRLNQPDRERLHRLVVSLEADAEGLHEQVMVDRMHAEIARAETTWSEDLVSVIYASRRQVSFIGCIVVCPPTQTPSILKRGMTREDKARVKSALWRFIALQKSEEITREFEDLIEEKVSQKELVGYLLRKALGYVKDKEMLDLLIEALVGLKKNLRATQIESGICEAIARLEETRPREYLQIVIETLSSTGVLGDVQYMLYRLCNQYF